MVESSKRKPILDAKSYLVFRSALSLYSACSQNSDMSCLMFCVLRGPVDWSSNSAVSPQSIDYCDPVILPWFQGSFVSTLPVLCFANKFSADSIRNPNQWLH